MSHPPIPDWNLIVSIRAETFREAVRLLREFGPVKRTDYYNVLVMKVADPRAFLAEFAALVGDHPAALEIVARVAPVLEAFEVESAEDLLARLPDACAPFLPLLAGKAFHCRMHLRGLKLPIPRPEAEKALNLELLARLEAAGTPGRIAFDEAQAVLPIDVVDSRAGLGCWTREEIAANPWLKPG